MTQIKLVPKKKSLVATVELLDDSVVLGHISNSVTGHTYALWLRDMQSQCNILLNSLGGSQLSSVTEAKQSVDLVDLKPQEALQEAIVDTEVLSPVVSTTTDKPSDTFLIDGWNLKRADKKEHEPHFPDIIKLYPQFFTARQLCRFYPRIHSKQVKWMFEGQYERTLIKMSSLDDSALWELIDKLVFCGQLKPEHSAMVRRAFQNQINQYRIWSGENLIYLRQAKGLHQLPPKTLTWDSFYKYGKDSFMIKKTNPVRILFHYLDHSYDISLNGQTLKKLLDKLLLIWDTKESQLDGWRTSVSKEIVEHYRTKYGIELA